MAPASAPDALSSEADQHRPIDIRPKTPAPKACRECMRNRHGGDGEAGIVSKRQERRQQAANAEPHDTGGSPENTATRTVAAENQVTMDACAPDAWAAVLPRAAAAS